jgi:lipopolysaccharide transport system permease protein
VQKLIKRKERVTVIKPNVNPFDLELAEVWNNRDLLYFLTWRDIKVRYKQTVLGILWIILQPLVSMVLFTLVFGNFAKIPSDNIPYPIFVFIGLIFWNFFAATLTNASNSLVANENILKKVYFPRIIAPISSTLSCLVDLIPTTVILIVMMVIYGVKINFQILLLAPVLFAMVFIAALGLGIFLAPINAKYRDVRYVLPYFIQMGLFATPVIYSTSLFGGTSRTLRMFNPVAEAIEIFRSVLFNTRQVEWWVFGIALLVTLLTFVIGLYVFKRGEKTFIDII